MTTLGLFASAVVAAMFIAPDTTSGSNFTPGADQPAKLAQNRCTPAHQQLCRQHHDECVKKSGSNAVWLLHVLLRVSRSRVLSRFNMQEMIKSGRILIDARQQPRLKIRHRLFRCR